jgi:hypothetical protein
MKEYMGRHVKLLSFLISTADRSERSAASPTPGKQHPGLIKWTAGCVLRLSGPSVSPGECSDNFKIGHDRLLSNPYYS